jgi:hypothetical protein
MEKLSADKFHRATSLNDVAGAEQTRRLRMPTGPAKPGQFDISEREPADGTSAAAQNRHFGMSRWAARS